jgi:hypothetical protein
MTTDEMLFFCGSVLGPALLAQELARLLEHIPGIGADQPASPTREDGVGRLLLQAFPDGLDL